MIFIFLHLLPIDGSPGYRWIWRPWLRSDFAVVSASHRAKHHLDISALVIPWGKSTLFGCRKPFVPKFRNPVQNSSGHLVIQQEIAYVVCGKRRWFVYLTLKQNLTMNFVFLVRKLRHSISFSLSLVYAEKLSR